MCVYTIPTYRLRQTNSDESSMALAVEKIVSYKIIIDSAV